MKNLSEMKEEKLLIDIRIKIKKPHDFDSILF